MRRAFFAWLPLLVACSTTHERTAASPDDVRAAETAFAQSMADRDFDAFAAHVADDAVFGAGDDMQVGKRAVLAKWKKFFEKPEAPFSWKPETAKVVGDLGYTEGPVMSPDGKVFARFHTTWQRGANGRWLVVFDNGALVGQCEK